MSNIHQKRIEHISEMLLDKPADTFLLFALAKEYDAIGEIPKAIEHYDRVIDLDEQYVGAYYHQAELLHRSGNVSRAIEIGEKGLEVAKRLGAQKDVAELYQLIESF